MSAVRRHSARRRPLCLGRRRAAFRDCAEITGQPLVSSPDFGKVRFDPILCMSVAEGAGAGEGVDAEEIPGGHVASVTHKGSYPDVPKAYEALFKWVGEKGLKPAGPAHVERAALRTASGRPAASRRALPGEAELPAAPAFPQRCAAGLGAAG